MLGSSFRQIFKYVSDYKLNACSALIVTFTAWIVLAFPIKGSTQALCQELFGVKEARRLSFWDRVQYKLSERSSKFLYRGISGPPNFPPPSMIIDPAHHWFEVAKNSWITVPRWERAKFAGHSDFERYQKYGVITDGPSQRRILLNFISRMSNLWVYRRAFFGLSVADSQEWIKTQEPPLPMGGFVNDWSEDVLRLFGSMAVIVRIPSKGREIVPDNFKGTNFGYQATVSYSEIDSEKVRNLLYKVKIGDKWYYAEEPEVQNIWLGAVRFVELVHELIWTSSEDVSVEQLLEGMSEAYVKSLAEYPGWSKSQK